MDDIGFIGFIDLDATLPVAIQCRNSSGVPTTPGHVVHRVRDQQALHGDLRIHRRQPSAGVHRDVYGDLMSMSDYWKDFGLGLMNLFDLPGSMVRDIFAWENPLDQIASPFSAKDRATGADVLRNFGVEDPGMLAGMGVEFLLDPLMLAGGLGALKGAKMSAKLGPRYRTTFRKRIENLDDAGSIRVTDERRILPPSDPVERALLREIPPGSKRLGEGFEAMALETPQGGVVRVARSPLHGGNIHSTDIPESAIVESMRIPDVEQMVPVRRHAVIRASRPIVSLFDSDTVCLDWPAYIRLLDNSFSGCGERSKTSRR